MSTYNRRTFLKTSGALLGGIAAGTTVTAAERTDRFIVQTRGKSAPGGLDVVHEMPGVDVAVVRGSEKAVRKSKRVKDYAPDIEISLDLPDVNSKAPTVDEASIKDEPLYNFQWDKKDLEVGTAQETTTGEGTQVTIIDTGVAADHPDLSVNEDLSRNFTGDGLGSANPAGGYHGSHVGGIVAAQDNEVGVIGTAPETDLVDCRVFSPSSLASFGDILAAVTYSANIGADAANLSLGAYPVPRQRYGSFYGKVLNSTMTYANKEGTLLVIAAGNDGADLQHDNNVCDDFDDDEEEECYKNIISVPNEGAQALSVSATGPIGFNWGEEGLEAPPETPAQYTNYGTNAVDLGAPGGNYDPALPPEYFYDLVFNTIADPSFDDDGNYLGASYGYAWLAGTSMAAPNVAGAAALVKSANPEYNANQVESALKGAADVPMDYDKTFYGSGYLNILDAL